MESKSISFELEPVSFELAKKLEEIGFLDKIGRLGGKSYYNYEGILNGDSLMTLKHRHDSPNNYKNISAPTLELAKTWFRKKHNLIIEACMSQDGKWYFDMFYHPDAKKDYKLDQGKTTFEWWDSFDEALEKGLLQAAKRI